MTKLDVTPDDNRGQTRIIWLVNKRRRVKSVDSTNDRTDVAGQKADHDNAKRAISDLANLLGRRMIQKAAKR